MDSDIHVLEPMGLWAQYLDPKWRDRVPGPPPPDTSAWMTFEGRSLPAYADTPERSRALDVRYASRKFADRMIAKGRGRSEASGEWASSTPDSMLAAMDVEGIDVAIVFRSFAAHLLVFDDMDPEFAAALCRAFNRWLHEFCSSCPARIKPGAQIPLHDADVAVAEARHAVEHLGAVTLVLPSHPVNRRTLYDRHYDPLWQVAEELDVAVSFHGVQAAYNAGMLATRYNDNLVLAHAVAQPIELMTALGEIVAGGVAARFPGVRFAFLEGNCGWLPWWLYALDVRWKEWGDEERLGQRELPSELFIRQCWIAMDVDEELAAHTIERLGDSNIVLSTDWPHDDSAFPHAIDEFFAIDALSRTSRRRILWDNCARLYGLE